MTRHTNPWLAGKERRMLASGVRLGPYQIIGPLGRGGMGEVYRAKDLRLDREVAVKVVPEQMAQDSEFLARFEREAKAVAGLAHPNILVLYDIGRDQGIPFAVTELLEGSTLRGRLAAGPLPWREALEIGVAVAEGLAAAHGKGIIHRDIKPENLFLTADGRVKILDFGLARVEVAAEGDYETSLFVPRNTEPGRVVGTAGYISPEQLRGQPADAKSDVFSLGCVLYELVTRQRPFRGKTAAEIAAAILHDQPPWLPRQADMPPEVERVIGHCLAKEPSQRLSSARDLAFALRALLGGSDVSRLSNGATAPPMRVTRAKPQRRPPETVLSLAVLPLANANVDPELEYLSDGITDGIINLLSQLAGLRVMARSTVFRYKSREIDPQEVGRALKVQSVLTGQLFLRGNRVVIKVELVDVADGSQLWGEHYNRELSDIQAIETAIAQEISEKLRFRLTGEQKRRIDQPRTENPQAYQCYLKGRYHWNKRSGEGLKKSIRFFEQAIEIEPTYAMAYTGIADAYLNLGGWGHLPFREAYPRAKAAAMKALAIDDNLAEAHVSLAMAHKEYDWDWPSAGKAYQRALALAPNYATAHQWYGEYLACLGRFEEGLAELWRAVELDPLSLIIHATLGRHGYYFARQYDRAIDQLRQTLEMDDKFWVARLWLGWTYATIGRLSEALGELETAQRLDDNLEIVAALGYAHGRAGSRAQAQQMLDQLEELSHKRYVSPMISAIIAIGIGDHDAALGWLEKGYQDKSQMLSELRVETAFDPLRADPRFVNLLQRVGLEA